jgi:methionine-gamma-lyase
MAAISSAILAICNSGDHVVCSNCVYGGTFAFMKTYLPLKAGINVSFVDITDLEAVKAAFTSKTKVRHCQPCPF